MTYDIFLVSHLFPPTVSFRGVVEVLEVRGLPQEHPHVVLSIYHQSTVNQLSVYYLHKDSVIP